jgi:hypothetical protein
MATFLKFDNFVESLAEKEHDLGADQLDVALTATASAPVVGNSALADLTEIAYTNLSAQSITTTSSLQTSGIYKLILADLVLTASGTVAAFQYVVIFNQDSTTPDDTLIGWYDYGSSLVLLTSETLTIDFDDSGGFITIT